MVMAAAGYRVSGRSPEDLDSANATLRNPIYPWGTLIEIASPLT
jgi:hypothetical protein